MEGFPIQLKARFRQIAVPAWLLWAIVCCVVLFATPVPAVDDTGAMDSPPVLVGVVTHESHNGWLVPWRPFHRPRRWWRNEALRYMRRAVERARRHARWLTFLARLALRGALTMATVVDLLTRSQLRRYMGALPVLYALLETLQVRQIINRHCPTAADVDHGTVAVVLILNRLVAPRPLYWVADWVGRTVLVYTLDVPAEKFNDDRLGRTLEAISQHSREIWQDVVHRALVQADVTVRADVERLVQAGLNELGRLDVLVDNAAGFPIKPFAAVSEEEWERVMALDLKSVFLCCQAALAPMRQQRDGTIINVASVAGLVGAVAMAPYSAAKGGVIALTKALARELAPLHITVNAIAPGIIETETTLETFPPGALETYTTYQVPLGRLGRPEDVVGLAVFLASDEARYVTGQVFAVDGGFTMH